MELASTTPRKPVRRNKSTVTLSSKLGFFGDVQRDVLPVRCTTVDPFKNKDLLDLVRIARKLKKIFRFAYF